MKKTTKGLSILITFGSWGGFSLIKQSGAIRLGLGWIGVIVFLYDAENKLTNILTRTNP